MSDIIRTAEHGDRTFRYLESGEGPAVVLWHGFPDLPQSWNSIRASLAANGYRAIAPYLRGYHPDTIVPGLGYDADELAGDGLALLDALDIDRAVVMGHDWGAAITYGLAELAPERVVALSCVDIPHTATVRPNPKLLWGVRHFLGLKLPWAPWTMQRNDFAHVDTLYRRWAPDWHGPERQQSVASIKIAFEDPRVLDGALSYYRALRPTSGPPPKLPMPALLFAGGGNPVVVESFAHSADAFADGVDVLVDVVPGAGHWAHRENETHVLDVLLPWLARVHPA